MGLLNDIRRSVGTALGVVAFGYGAALAETPVDLPLAVNNGKAWKIYKTSWSADDERGYSDFVRAIGRSRCASLYSCLNSDANPYRSESDPALYGDCADMAYILRAYYAWKNGLPFSYQSAMRTADGKREDLRYSTGGNVVAGRRSATGAAPINAHGFLGQIGGVVSTAMFRTHPETGGGRGHDDFYSVEISREAVRPGAIAYDIYGHVGIVYDILDDGRILIVASHPDQSVTRTTYGPNFMRSKPELGAGVKAWRPIRLEGATQANDGSYRGGRVRGVANEDLPHFSMEQHFGNKPHPSGVWHYGEFRHNNRTFKYYDYVRRRLAVPGFAYDPITELRFGMQTICGSIKARKAAVDSAITAGIHLKPHPRKLPPNIFGTYGEWEAYSTPSRDARLKVSFIELKRDMAQLIAEVEAGEPGVRYDGADLAGDLWAAYEEEKNACRVTYWRSDKTRMRLNFAHVMDRLWDLSFDPYHCPERRWGARGAELETCTDDTEKAQWYNALRFLRYQAERTYDVRMDFALHELQPPMSAPPSEGGLGVGAPADADMRKFLLSLQKDVVAADFEGDAPLVFIANDRQDEPDGVFFPAWHATGGVIAREY